jgi:2-polyprenyl-6-methoxyphenol hydroxylase-like FAD-dependent oxidoreductase
MSDTVSYPQHRIAIAGAGMAGLATAILLTRQGMAVTLFDQVADPTPVGAGLLLQPSGQAVLARLGLLDAVRARAAQVGSLQGYVQGRRVLDLHYQHLNPAWHGLGIHRANLHQVLWQAAKACGVQFALGQAVTGFVHQAHGVRVQHGPGGNVGAATGVSAGTATSTSTATGTGTGTGTHTSTGTHPSTGTHEDEFAALIIANGTRSVLRSALPVKQLHQPYPWGAYWAVLERDDWPFPDILMQRYRGAHIMLGILPTGPHPQTGRTCYSLFWSVPKREFVDFHNQGLTGLLDAIKPVWPEVAEWLAAAPSPGIAIAEYADVRLSPWQHERVVVIGDAAHAMSPQLGQGANMALIDAWILAQELARGILQKTAQGSSQTTAPGAEAVPQALQRYSKRRAAHIAYYQLTSRIMTPLYQSHAPLGWLRDIGTVTGRQIGPVYRQYLRTLCGAKQGMLDFAASIENLLD